MIRIQEMDAYYLALFNLYHYSNGTIRMAKLDDLKAFYNKINYNLDKKNINIYGSYYELIDDNIYSITSDKNGCVYYILNENIDIEKYKSLYVGTLPLELLKASQENNALKELGLIKIDNKIYVINDVKSNKKDYECCSNCEFRITDVLRREIISENTEYSDMDEEEAFKQIGYCEIHKTIDIARNFDYWCPCYLYDEDTESIDKELVKK